MKERVVDQCLKILFRDWNKDQTRTTYHYAFAIKKNRIISLGKNKPQYPSKKALYFGKVYDIEKWKHFPYLHAESDLIAKLQEDDITRQLEILSIRINRHGEFRMAKPCVNCQKLLDSLNIQKITWSCNSPDRRKDILVLQKHHSISDSIIKPLNNISSVV